MKQARMFLVLSIATLSILTYANDKVIYGEDNRLDLFEVTNTLHADLANSTLAMIGKSNIKQVGEEYQISGPTLKSNMNLCDGEKFINQITAANCSAFLVTPKHIVTAGHCVKNLGECNKFKWVFDYNIENQNDLSYKVPASSVYGCKAVVAQVLDNSSQDDYAFIELDRAVTDRLPLTVRTAGAITANDPLVVIGHPTGLPAKISAGAIVRSTNHPKYFVSNLDTFGGNSGSAVFNAVTGIVEGILVRGETDYTYVTARKCYTPKYCTETGCRGEDVTRITNVKKLMDMLD